LFSTKGHDQDGYVSGTTSGFHALVRDGGDFSAYKLPWKPEIQKMKPILVLLPPS
jgi:hypothetical protein